MNRRPAASEYEADFYDTYVSRVPEEEILPVLTGQIDLVRRLADSVPAERETFRYAPDKWSIREVLGHLVDGERVFGFRAFCFSRDGETPLPGFDEKVYVASSNFDRRSLESLAGDFASVRAVNLSLFQSLDPGMWDRAGTAYGRRITVRALAYVMAGHVRHHLAVLAERYGVGPGA